MQPLNYTTNAISFYQRLMKSMKHINSSEYVSEDYFFTKWLCEVMTNAEKFFLPDSGRLFDTSRMRTIDEQQKILDFFRLPFPVTIIEYQMFEDLPFHQKVKDFSTVPCHKRIGLAIDISAKCWDILPQRIYADLIKDIPDAFGKNGCIVFSITENLHKEWSLPCVGMYLPYTQNIVGHVHGTCYQGACHIFRRDYALYIKNKLCEGDENKFFEMQTYDINDEAAALLEMTAVINCSNVSIASVKPSVLSNKIRRSNKKVPLFSYHVLEIGTQKLLQSDDSHCEPGKERGTKRMHLRRGHIRKLSKGDGTFRIIWVNSAIIGLMKTGIVHKDYAVPKLTQP